MCLEKCSLNIVTYTKIHMWLTFIMFSRDCAIFCPGGCLYMCEGERERGRERERERDREQRVVDYTTQLHTTGV